jgi:hypothetical protein
LRGLRFSCRDKRGYLHNIITIRRAPYLRLHTTCICSPQHQLYFVIGASHLQIILALHIIAVMFYSETLLSKTGPLARVWLSANLERKLSKNHILQASVKDSVEAIVTPNQAPMALRLTGQLLLGVVRIYSRKAHYLLDDCNEALIKIKMVGSRNTLLL